MHVHATASGFDKACATQFGKVMAYGRLAQFDRRREIATAHFAGIRLNSNETNFTRTGSANALSRNAIARAALSSTGPAATGEQRTGSDISTTGTVLPVRHVAAPAVPCELPGRRSVSVSVKACPSHLAGWASR
jgi:hypothetical protein